MWHEDIKNEGPLPKTLNSPPDGTHAGGLEVYWHDLWTSPPLYVALHFYNPMVKKHWCHLLDCSIFLEVGPHSLYIWHRDINCDLYLSLLYCFYLHQLIWVSCGTHCQQRMFSYCSQLTRSLRPIIFVWIQRKWKCGGPGPMTCYLKCVENPSYSVLDRNTIKHIHGRNRIIWSTQYTFSCSSVYYFLRSLWKLSLQADYIFLYLRPKLNWPC